MNRDQQEMALWRESYRASHCFLAQERARDADAAVAQFRQRYPAEPAAPPAVWYDEPPFAKDGTTHPCWIAGSERPPVLLYLAHVYWGGRNWRVSFLRDQPAVDLNARRVCPIIKPQEPTT